MGGGLSAFDLVNAGEKLDLKSIAIFNDTEANGGDGVDIDEDDGDIGNTCLTQAIKATIYDEKHRFQVVEDILNRGSDVNQLTALDETPLHTAAYMDRPDLMELLIARNCNINATAQGGWAPLHFAALAGNVECVQLLLNQEGINVHGTVGAKYSGKNALDLAFLRLDRQQHENALSYTNDDWTYLEITHKTRFYRCFDLLDMFINGEKHAKAERKRAMRRIKNPFEPIYDRRGRRKVYCTNCSQGYWSRTHNKFGKCPECRGTEKEERRQLWEDTREERMAQRKVDKNQEKQMKLDALRTNRSTLLYDGPDRNSNADAKDAEYDWEIQNIWTAALKTRALLAEDGSLNKKYYDIKSKLGTEESMYNEEDEKERLRKEAEAAKPKYNKFETFY